MRTILLILLITTNSIIGQAQNSNAIELGDTVTNFSALDENGDIWELKNNTSDFTVIYFYPAAMTYGCTKQACAYRDDKATFDQLNTTIVAVSGDSPENLQNFKKKYDLNFSLLSDFAGKLSKIFGVPISKGGSIERELFGKRITLTREITVERWTFVLDKNRKVIYKNSKVNAVQDSKNVKEAIKNYKVG